MRLWCDGTIFKNPILGPGLDKPGLSPQAEREGLSLNTDLTKYFISQGIISQLGGWKQLVACRSKVIKRLLILGK